MLSKRIKEKKAGIVMEEILEKHKKEKEKKYA